MLDFLTIGVRVKKAGEVEIYPKFTVKKTEDLMIRGSDFYAIWIEQLNIWSTNEWDALTLIDSYIAEFYETYKKSHADTNIHVMYMWDADSGMIDKFHKYCQKQMRDSYHMLDEKLVFSNDDVTKKDYATKRLNYPLEEGDYSSYDKLISTLYSEEERQKIEWAIGAIVTGDSKTIQKFLVFYGSAGTGKSTIINIIQKLFEGYYSVFDAKALGSSSNAFALEAFKDNPLVAIQHDGDLSKIEDNTRLNSLVSHEEMTINEKFKSTYTNRFKAFLIMGTNRPVKITDSRSGLIRRLIDVSPTGNKIPIREYKRLIKQVDFELGAIAYHCKEVYLSNPGKYDNYVPTQMLGASNDFYNFVEDSFTVFKNDDETTLKAAWGMYKLYCEDAKVPYPYPQRLFKEELKNYFKEFKERTITEDGNRIRNYYQGFKTDKFITLSLEDKDEKPKLIDFEEQDSIFDNECASCLAQYANDAGTPKKKWNDVKTELRHLDTSKLHYVKVPENHIVIDFDLKDSEGNKSFEKNLEAASKWPETYAELSKSGGGIHLHYIYTGDVSKLSRVYDDEIEVKVFTGNSSLRRLLSKCNNNRIATISSGLPLKGDKKMINFDSVKSEKGLRTLIKKNLNKEIHPGTKPSIDFIYKILDDAYESGLNYDITDMRTAILAFAANSTHQASYCMSLVNRMKFKSDNYSDSKINDEADLVFFDVEVFPNLFLINWKIKGKGRPVIRMINPSPKEVENLLKYRLVGFNCRRYDNHMLYACLMGYDNMQLYKLSQKIINSEKGSKNNGMFGEAYNISYTDVYDFCAKKQSLKKWEIELGIHHQELGLPWDEPVPESLWAKVAEYCDNDVLATEAVYEYAIADFVARQIQVSLVKEFHGITNVSVNDTTNALSTKIIFGKNKHPQNEFNYRDLSKPVGPEEYPEYIKKFGADYTFRVFDEKGVPLYRDYVPGEKLPKGYSILPFFPGYVFENGVSIYLGEEIGEGGKVYGVPGIWGNVWDGDVSSMHPHSIIYECIFGPTFTRIFEEIVLARVDIKHKDFDSASKRLRGVLKPYLNEEQAPQLAYALKIIINSIYGLTSARFANAFRDPRNIDNIVAKRGALFMTLLKQQVEQMGYKVCHIKTDSIKIPDADTRIREFVIKFGKEFGYTFETEADFEKFCLVNNAVYVAKLKEPEINKKTGKKKYWTATGEQFKEPYVFKTLFSKEPVTFEDMCHTFSVTKGALYLDKNESLLNVEDKEEVLKKLKDKIDRVHAKWFKKNITFPEDERTALDLQQCNESLETYRKDASRLNDLNKEYSKLDSYLKENEDKAHNYKFVGRVGEFCPIKPGKGGAILLRGVDDKYYAATGSKGYRWMESESVKMLEKEEDIDKTYFTKLVDEAIASINNYGDFEWFASDDPYISTDPIEKDSLGFDIYSDELPF